MSPFFPAFLRRWRGETELSSARVARYYDDWHERYMAAFGDTFPSQLTGELGELFTHIADQAELVPGMRVLDAGCGIAGPALWLARHRGVNVSAVNISAVQVAEARERIDAAGLGDRVVVSLGDYHRLEELYAPTSFDAVLFLESLVHSDHPQVALASVHRVLKPGGQFLFLEHGLSPDAQVARWQHRLNPIQNRIGGGCHLIRDTAQLVERSGLHLRDARHYYLRRVPRFAGYMTEGSALKS